ncbi:MAG TPA: hypothetical protein VLA72_04770 [Anaerolineales bacterium]|nr:hypothetical protein [Anaerolineales bacterium]
MMTFLQNLVETIRDEPRKGLYWLIGGLFLLYALRGCFPNLSGNALPADVSDSIQRSNINCLADTPILPGYPAQPECGSFTVDMVAEGQIPTSTQEVGVSQAICYRITVKNPQWRTMQGVRMEIISTSQNFSKVAVLQNGEWQTFPDQDQQDEQRWIEYGCPGSYLVE